MGNPPFLPPKLSDTVPKGGWNVFTGPWEDGPGFFLNPANTGQPVRYNGQDQVKTINSAQLPPPITPAKCTLPGAAVGLSKIFSQP
jgi:hypothetical protein